MQIKMNGKIWYKRKVYPYCVMKTNSVTLEKTMRKELVSTHLKKLVFLGMKHSPWIASEAEQTDLTMSTV